MRLVWTRTFKDNVTEIWYCSCENPRVQGKLVYEKTGISGSIYFDNIEKIRFVIPEGSSLDDAKNIVEKEIRLIEKVVKYDD